VAFWLGLCHRYESRITEEIPARLITLTWAIVRRFTRRTDRVGGLSILSMASRDTLSDAQKLVSEESSSWSSFMLCLPYRYYVVT
jgi:hypothetical protein